MALTTIITANNRLTDAGVRMALKRVMVGAHSAHVSPTGLTASLTDLAYEVHQRNVEVGWWSNLRTGEPIQRNVGELLMLAVSELGEIPPYPEVETRKDDKLPERLMIDVEFADACIRLFDIIGGLAPHAIATFAERSHWRAENTYTLMCLDRYLMELVRLLSEAMESHRKGRILLNATGPDTGKRPGFDHYLGMTLFRLFDLAHGLGMDLDETIAEKMEFNAHRADHKLENRRGDGGKAY